MLDTVIDADGETRADNGGTSAEPAEHSRLRAYVAALADVSDTEELGLVDSILRDPDRRAD